MNQLPVPPFIGREALLAQLHQFLSAPAPYALSIQSMEGLGRSSLLRRIATLDPSLVCVLLPLTSAHFSSLEAWLEALANETLQALQEAGLASARLPAPDASDLPRWFSEAFLPAVGRHVRQQARVIWLLDDIDLMGEAIHDGRLPSAHPAYLLELMLAFPFLSIVTSADEDSPHLGLLHPLIQLDHVVRLGPLGRLEVEQLLMQLLDYVPPVLAERAYVETGGMPRQIYDFVEAIRRGDPPDDAVDFVYARCQTEMRRRWDRLTRDERVVLTAIIELRHEHPQQALTPESIELWLAQSDYPMDSTAIAAQLRGLEFRHMLRPQRRPIRLQSGLLERWLLEHARQEIAQPAPSPRRALIIGLMGVMLTALLIAFLIASVPPAAVMTEVPRPTLPLGGTN